MAKQDKDVNAIDLLESQHREVEELFQQLEDNEDDESAEQIFIQLADKLAIHAKIEELHFYPAVKAQRTEDILLEALEEHLSAKRVIADLLDMDSSDEQFEPKCKVLQELIEHHVEEEETEYFPELRKSDMDLKAAGAGSARKRNRLARAAAPKTSFQTRRRTSWPAVRRM